MKFKLYALNITFENSRTCQVDISNIDNNLKYVKGLLCTNITNAIPIGVAINSSKTAIQFTKESTESVTYSVNVFAIY